MATCVAVASSRLEAQLMVDLLHRNGIAASFSADDLGGVDPALAAQGVRVLVGAGHAAHARRLLADDGEVPRPLNAFQRWVVRLLSRGE